MLPNGPAIKGGCVTWRSIRAGSWYFSREIVPVQDRYGVLFAVFALRSFSEGGPGTNFIACRRGRGTSFINGRDIVPVDEVAKMAMAQCRGTNCLGGRKLSWYRILIACSCACPGAGLSTGPGKWLRVMQKA